MRTLIKNSLCFLFLFGIYFITGKLGLSLQAVHKFATFIWLPTGIALSALFILGLRFWPAIHLASFILNYSLGAKFFVALGISTGNTIEACTAVFLLRKTGFQNFFRFSDSVKFILLGVPFGTLISATMGAGSLWVGNTITTQEFDPTWTTWWVGDMAGALVIAPFIIAWCKPRGLKLTPVKVLEALCLACTAAFLSCFMFLNWFDPNSSSVLRPHLYLLFPLLIWAAVRFSPRAGISILTLYAGTATWTVIKHPNFFPQAANDAHSIGLFQLGTFLLIAAITNLVLSTALEERRQAIHTRDEFFNIASHELKTPLTSLKLQTQIALHKLLKNKEPNANESYIINLLKLNDIQISKLNRLIDDMFDVAKVNSGILKLNLQQVDFSATVSEIIERMESQLSAAGCNIELKIEKQIVTRVDRTRIEQAIENLISNACKYGAGKPIEIKTSSDSKRIKFSVKDHGIGIDKKDHERIFNRFERGNSSQQMGGLGLGLYIVNQIIKKHNGYVKVESQIGKGSTFSFSLPV